MRHVWRAAAASAAVYVAVTAIFGRDVLSNLAGMIAADEGDPLLVAAILHWNATMLPLTDAWWQFPAFDPTRDTLTFSEHFLGVSPISTPLHWITRSAVVTYNLVTLLTFPLCGAAMFALAYRLTRNAAAAFLAGLAFAFAPYRFSQLPHLQMLAFFWAPLALLGLHAYLESGRARWLVLYGAAWMLQGAANSYALVFLSVFVGLWVLWFVVARRNWTALAAIAVATLIAALPLAPIVLKYVSVHAMNGFTRDPGEIRAYGADLTALVCAPAHLTFWRWLNATCHPEGELFPGAAVAVLAVVTVFRLTGSGESAPTRLSLGLTVLSRLLLATGLVYAVVTCAVIIGGPWRIAIGPLRMSASSIAKPVMLATVASLLGLLLSPRIRAAARGSSIPGFYIIAAILTWLLALGPTIKFMGTARGFQAPFALLMYLPGVQGLRVPARFWLLTTMCLAVLVGLLAASLLERRRRAVVAAVVAVMSALLLADGWVARIPAAPVPAAVPNPQLLQSAAVLSLPMGILRDIAAEFRAITGGWRSVNGYSGYFPSYYAALADASSGEEDGVVAPFVQEHDLHVILTEEAPRLKAMLERQPGIVVTGAANGVIQYRIPRRAALPDTDNTGERLRIESVKASCQEPFARDAVDGNERTRWECGPQKPGHELIVDLGQPRVVGAVVQNLAEYNTNYPRHLVIDTSIDGSSWDAAWDGSIRGLLIAQAIERPGPFIRFTVPFARREARYVRLRQAAADQTLPWSIAELEVWSGH